MGKGGSEEMPKRSRMLTTTEAARHLSVHPNTVRRWEKQGLLPAYRLGTRGDRRFLREAVDRFLNSSASGNSQGRAAGNDDAPAQVD
jgi:excisionase family DNA binding protein